MWIAGQKGHDCELTVIECFPGFDDERSSIRCAPQRCSSAAFFAVHLEDCRKLLTMICVAAHQLECRVITSGLDEFKQLFHQRMVDGRGDPNNIADRSDCGDMKPSPVGTGIDDGHGQCQVPTWMLGNADRQVAEIIGVVFAKLLDPFSLVHSALVVGMHRQLDCPAFRTAELEIEACSVLLAVFHNQL